MAGSANTVRNQNSATLHAEMDNSHESLSRAKDRAQLTATGAMSIVNIALLKQIFDQGPEENPYYVASIALICTSLGLQVVAGLLSIVMTCHTGYYAKHQDDVCEDLCENMCGCRCICGVRRRRTFLRTRHTTVSHQPLGSFIDGHEAIELATGTDNASDGPEIRSVHSRCSDKADAIGCCPCCITSRTLEDFEYDILDLYHNWEAKGVSLELQAAESKIRVKYWTDTLPKLNEAIDQIKSSENSDNDELRRLEQELAKCKENIDKHERITHEWQVGRAKGQYLRERASTIRSNQILKRATFGQHFINFLFFLVFILNAFITGLGIVGNDDKSIPAQIPAQT